MAYLKVDRDIGKPDPKFKDKLKQELPGIYNWIMQISFDDAVAKIIEYRGGKQNSDVQKEMLDGQSSVYAWMIDPDDSDINLYCIPGEKVPSRIAYGRYKSWCSVYSYTPLNSRNWKKEMVKGGAEVVESNFTYFVAPEKDKVNVSNMLGL
jgi:phage/plasmid-associated DNA primase